MFLCITLNNCHKILYAFLTISKGKASLNYHYLCISRSSRPWSFWAVYHYHSLISVLNLPCTLYDYNLGLRHVSMIILLITKLGWLANHTKQKTGVHGSVVCRFLPLLSSSERSFVCVFQKWFAVINTQTGQNIANSAMVSICHTCHTCSCWKLIRFVLYRLLVTDIYRSALARHTFPPRGFFVCRCFSFISKLQSQCEILFSRKPVNDIIITKVVLKIFHFFPPLQWTVPLIFDKPNVYFATWINGSL